MSPKALRQESTNCIHRIERSPAQGEWYQVPSYPGHHGEERVCYFEWARKPVEVCEQDISTCKTPNTVNPQKVLAFIFTSLDSEGNLHSAF